jgi:putative oxidoreductase
MAVFARIRSALSPYAMLPVRFGAGLCLVLHGWTKLANPHAFLGTVGGFGLPYAEPLAWAAIGVEVLGGILLLVGFLSRFVAFLGLFVVGVAIAFVNGGNGFFASGDGVELPLLVGLMLLGVLLGGAGRASVDSFRGKI